MAERTADEVATIFSAAGDSVTLINTSTSAAAGETDAEWKDRINRNVEHLELMKAKDDWGSEDMAATTKAITDG